MVAVAFVEGVDFAGEDAFFLGAGVDDCKEGDLELFGLGCDDVKDAVTFDFFFCAIKVSDEDFLFSVAFGEFSCDA